MSLINGVVIPLDVLRIVVSFIPHPETLCRLACTNRCFAQLIENEEVLWESLYRLRWKHHDMGDNIKEGFREEYKVRHSLDSEAFHILLRMAQEMITTSIEEQQLSSLEGFKWGKVRWDHDGWSQLFRFGANIRGWDMSLAVVNGDESYFVIPQDEDQSMARLRNNFVSVLAGEVVMAVHYSRVLSRMD